MLLIENEKYLDDTIAFAKQIGFYEPTPSGKNNGSGNHYLKNRLDYLNGYGGKNSDGTDRTRVRLFKDFAPYSFGFVIESKDDNGEWSTWFHGGLLFHGPHDGNGGGAGPTFAVTLTPTVGWVVHT
jgi:hypothetical protein